MPAGKLTGDAARGHPGSTVVVAMARNGTDFGIQVSGTGDQWFTGPASTRRACSSGLRAGRRQPRHRRLGHHRDRAASAASRWPRRRRSCGSSAARSATRSRRPGGCTRSRWPRTRRSPGPGARSSAGRPPASTSTRVVRTGILPQINTGMAGRVAGTGQVGAGLVNPPASIFPEAVTALAALAPPVVGAGSSDPARHHPHACAVAAAVTAHLTTCATCGPGCATTAAAQDAPRAPTS